MRNLISAIFIILIPLFFSGLFIFTVERGNLVLISAGAVAYFVALYDSERVSERKLAIIMLAVASCLKVYPALFGLLYIRKKMYKELLCAAVLSIISTFLSFLFFEDGFSNISKLISNVYLQNEIYSNYARTQARWDIGYMTFYFLKNTGLLSTDLNISLSQLSSLILKFLAIFALISSLFSKDEYIALVLAALGVMFLPASSELYCGLYLFPAIILLFKEKQNKKIIFCHALFYLFYLSPLQFKFFVDSRYILILITILFLIINILQNLYLRIKNFMIK